MLLRRGEQGVGALGQRIGPLRALRLLRSRLLSAPTPESLNGLEGTLACHMAPDGGRTWRVFGRGSATSSGLSKGAEGGEQAGRARGRWRGSSALTLTAAGNGSFMHQSPRSLATMLDQVRGSEGS